ncbi:MAG: DUF3391 domain-containing protein [Nitrospira sp.]
MAHRKILLADLAVGMYLVGLDRSWLQTPFLRHKFTVTDCEQIALLRQSGVREVTIDTEQGLDVPESTLAQQAGSPASNDSVDESDAGAKRVVESVKVPTVVVLADNLAVAKQRRLEWMNRLNHLFEHTRATGMVSYEEACQLVEDMIGVIVERQAACYAVTSLRESDPALYEHGLTVCTLAIIMGQVLRHPREVLQRIGLAALLHDIGLTRLPRNITKRSPGLAPAHQALYDSHASQGVSMLERSGVDDQAVLSAIRNHHDLVRVTSAAGQTHGMVYELTRIVGVVDQYDEFVTGQSGLPPMSSSQAMTQLYQRYREQQGLQETVSYLVRTIGVYPLYSLVSLNSGELGIVGGITPGKAHLPTLYVCRDASGHGCVPPVELDLVREPDGGRVILDVCDPRRVGIDVESVLREVAA